MWATRYKFCDHSTPVARTERYFRVWKNTVRRRKACSEAVVGYSGLFFHIRLSWSVGEKNTLNSWQPQASYATKHPWQWLCSGTRQNSSSYFAHKTKRVANFISIVNGNSNKPVGTSFIRHSYSGKLHDYTTRLEALHRLLSTLRHERLIQICR